MVRLLQRFLGGFSQLPLPPSSSSTRNRFASLSLTHILPSAPHPFPQPTAAPRWRELGELVVGARSFLLFATSLDSSRLTSPQASSPAYSPISLPTTTLKQPPQNMNFESNSLPVWRPATIHLLPLATTMIFVAPSSLPVDAVCHSPIPSVTTVSSSSHPAMPYLLCRRRPPIPRDYASTFYRFATMDHGVDDGHTPCTHHPKLRNFSWR
ncbi:hypothetical protein BDN72DRAFT_905025 [Pluteus cervinus]|uniref:Uncharacterized protein n=1 Tax=Pluteus cervinus TaxID=181527 RepID=A0ACD3A4S4_9AGAR|nr:hypothetical protein BDN72DRAFT_905025 [Pluteus cervinus]